MVQDGRGVGLCRSHSRFHTGIGEYVSRSFAQQVFPQQHHVHLKDHQPFTDANTLSLFNLCVRKKMSMATATMFSTF
jgi:hypothetical protein